MAIKSFLGNYLINKKKFDEILQYISSEDKEVVMVGAGIIKEMMGINENIIRTSVKTIRINDKISWRKEENGKGVLVTGKVVSIGNKNIIVEKAPGDHSSLLKESLEEDVHFSIITQ